VQKIQGNGNEKNQSEESLRISAAQNTHSSNPSPFSQEGIW
jgi:hypothetical protein